MCNPALLLGIGGAVIQGVSAFQGQQTQAANYRIQQESADRDAALRRESGAYEGTQAINRGKQFIAKQTAGYSSHGISPASGTPLDVITSTGADVGLDVQAARYGTSRAIENDKYRGRVAGYNASATEASAPFAFISPIIGAGATFLKSQYA